MEVIFEDHVLKGLKVPKGFADNSLRNTESELYHRRWCVALHQHTNFNFCCALLIVHKREERFLIRFAVKNNHNEVVIALLGDDNVNFNVETMYKLTA